MQSLIDSGQLKPGIT